MTGFDGATLPASGADGAWTDGVCLTGAGAEGSCGVGTGLEGTEGAGGAEGTEGVEGTDGTDGVEGTDGTDGTVGTGTGAVGTDGTDGTVGTCTGSCAGTGEAVPASPKATATTTRQARLYIQVPRVLYHPGGFPKQFAPPGLTIRERGTPGWSAILCDRPRAGAGFSFARRPTRLSEHAVRWPAETSGSL